MSQCEAAESSSQINPQVIDGKERSSLDEVLRQGDSRQIFSSRPWKPKWPPTSKPISTKSTRTAGGWWCATVTPASCTLVSGVGQLKIQAPRGRRSPSR